MVKNIFKKVIETRNLFLFIEVCYFSLSRLKEYLQENSPDRVQPFQAGMMKLAKEIIGKFDEYRFYLGENMNIDGMVVLQYYREDGLTPVFILLKDGLREEKYVSLKLSFLKLFSIFAYFSFLVNKWQPD